jgi:thiol-disulfide isomerase/thioredoxin
MMALAMGRIERGDCDTPGCVFGSTKECSKHNAQPHFVKAAVMGRDIACEMVEAWYKIHEMLQYACTTSAKALERRVCADSFNVGLDPANVLRSLHLSLGLAQLALHPAEGQNVVGLLRRIGKKHGFRLCITLSQDQLSLSLWPAVCDIFRPVLEEFEKEGADVTINVMYFSESFEVVEWSLLEAIKNPESKWKEDAYDFYRNVGLHYSKIG